MEVTTDDYSHDKSTSLVRELKFSSSHSSEGKNDLVSSKGSLSDEIIVVDDVDDVKSLDQYPKCSVAAPDSNLNEDEDDDDEEEGSIPKEIKNKIIANLRSSTSSASDGTASPLSGSQSSTPTVEHRELSTSSKLKMPPKLTKEKKTGSFYESLRMLSNIPESDLPTTTQAKVIATKRFFHEYYWDLFIYLRKRQSELDRIKHKVVKGEISPSNLNKVLGDCYRHHSNELRKKRSRTRAKDFQILAKIGKGGFGDVYLCRNIKNKGIFAMKRIRKDFIAAKNKRSHIQTESNILSDQGSPWLVHLAYSFQDRRYVYLIMEYVAGGDLRGLLSNMGFFPEVDARFYIAEMILAVIDLHKLGFIHRDLKPENFLITREGHIKLGDFGLSKRGVKASFNIGELNLKALSALGFKLEDWRRRSADFPSRKTLVRSSSAGVVGSPNYMAVEVLRQTGYDFTVDYWSLGVIFFELLTGVTPFEGDTPDEVFRNILNYKEVMDVFFHETSDDFLSSATREFLSKLICEPSERIGRKGLEDFQNLQLFKGFDWDNIRNTTPPFVPKLSSETDVSYFELPQDGKDSVDEFNEYVKKHFGGSGGSDEFLLGRRVSDLTFPPPKSKFDLMKSI